MEDETEDNDVVRRGDAVRRKTWRKKKKSKKENDDKEGDKMQKKDNKDEETEEEEKNWDYFIHNSSLFIGHLLYQTMDSFPTSNSFGIFLLTIYTNNI